MIAREDPNETYVADAAGTIGGDSSNGTRSRVAAASAVVGRAIPLVC
jgi:hypothetical protein